MLTVHHLENSRSQHVPWLPEELGVPHEVVRYRRGPDLRAPASLKAVHPLGESPAITDGTRTIAESGAIIEYPARSSNTSSRPMAKAALCRRPPPRIGCAAPTGCTVPKARRCRCSMPS